MRSSKPVCLLCRLQAAQRASKTGAAQWQTQPARLFTRLLFSRRDTPGASNAAPNGAIAPDPKSTQSLSPPQVRRIPSTRHHLESNTRGPHFQLSQSKATGKPPSSRVDALFQQIIQEQDSLHADTGHPPEPVRASTDIALVKAIGKLQDMVDGDVPVSDAYLVFQSEIIPVIQVPGTHVPQAYHKVTLALLEKLVAAKKADMYTDTLPTLANIFRIYAELDELQPTQWAILVGELIQCIVDMDSSAETESIVQFERIERNAALRKVMLGDLIDSWKVFSLPRLATSPIGENQLTKGFWFPRLDKFALSKFSKKGNFSAAFSTLFPQYPRNHLGEPVAVLAIATFALMHDSQMCPVDVRQNATRFMSKVASLLIFVDYRDGALQNDLRNTFPGLERYVMELWPKIKEHLKQESASLDGGPTDMYRPLVPTKEVQANLIFNPTSIGYRLSRLHGTGNVRELDKLWEEFVGSEVTISKERADQIRLNPHLIDSFIKTRMTFNQPDKAIATWNLIGKVGLKPSLRTWNLMLDGLRKAGNVDGIKNIWIKLARSGLKLDTAIWTTRVAGLIDCGDVEGGLQALEEMARLWERDPTKTTAVAPTIEPVNAALAGLVHTRQHGVAEKLLAWAGKKGIKPDVVTFNTMLRLVIRDGNRHKDVEQLFTAMQAQGVRADEATFTIILDASFSKDDVRDPEDQANIVTNVASAMSAAGLELNIQTYGKMIYLLLRSNATTAAMAVVNHLYNRNLELSPHIYTMLVEHCFKQTPPALDSVRLFVQRRRHLDFDDMDRIFYDRVVKNYALVGEVHAALDIYKHVVGAGSSVPLPTLTDLLVALIRQDRFQDARVMVNTEKKRFENQRPDSEEHVQYWGNRFWQIAQKYNLLDSPLPSPQVPSV
ncbi:hypothetical protein F5B22DRAFT_165816 [Xylaria bambusicola]|uniref:uncharacterized protein n=1 Tax=Xylaria bambusicola TaxID=326684 RepID=UPI002007D26D|nr:uncharacterized protein F5B22DRAFT_165816 [Xylaria bambusicola]KAI0526563.1 hypothetical protein F5B22DRAFT_165816 [Xylaria bambusicola]